MITISIAEIMFCFLFKSGEDLIAHLEINICDFISCAWQTVSTSGVKITGKRERNFVDGLKSYYSEKSTYKATQAWW